MNNLKPLSQTTINFSQARAMLPLVRSIAVDTQTLELQIRRRRHDLNLVTRGGTGKSAHLYNDELLESQQDLENDQRQLESYKTELYRLGVDLVCAEAGEIEFPIVFQNRPVYLCWKVGEEEIGFWREADQPFYRRQPIPSSALLQLSASAGF